MTLSAATWPQSRNKAKAHGAVEEELPAYVLHR
jgi:hypothetical protein